MSIKQRGLKNDVIERMERLAIGALIVFSIMVVVMFICDICDVDKCLHLDSDWPAIISSSTSVIVAIGIGIATLKRMMKQK